jgi:hypothetical protein
MSSDHSNGIKYLSDFYSRNSSQTIKNIFIRLQKALGNFNVSCLSDLEGLLFEIQQNTLPWTREDLDFGIKPLQMMVKIKPLVIFVKIMIATIRNYSLYNVIGTKLLVKSQFALNTVESSCHVVINVASSTQRSHDLCYELLELCKEMLISSGNSESLPQLSATFYNVAGLLYKVDLNSALQYAQASESVYKEYLKNHENESWINLAKKQDMVASIQLSLSHKGDGIRKWIEVIKSIPVQEWTVFSEHSSDSYLLKIVQRYIKAVSDSEKDYRSIIDLIQKESCGKDCQYRIMEYELNTLIAFHEYMNTSKLQIRLLKRMLELSTDQNILLRYTNLLLSR